jgi:hypothetical protein
MSGGWGRGRGEGEFWFGYDVVARRSSTGEWKRDPCRRRSPRAATQGRGELLGAVHTTCCARDGGSVGASACEAVPQSAAACEPMAGRGRSDTGRRRCLSIARGAGAEGG